MLLCWQLNDACITKTVLLIASSGFGSLSPCSACVQPVSFVCLSFFSSDQNLPVVCHYESLILASELARGDLILGILSLPLCVLTNRSCWRTSELRPYTRFFQAVGYYYY